MERNRKIWMQILVLAAVLRFFPFDFQTAVSTASEDVAAECAGGEEQKPKIALTFDDGPNIKYTPMLLDGLKERGIKATFFLVGQWIERYPDSVRQIVDAGHEIGNHSYSHVDFVGAGEEVIRQQMEKTDALIREVTGSDPVLARVPSGSYDSRVIRLLRQEGYEVIQWDVDSIDWKKPPAKEITERILTKVQNGSIVLFHSGAATTLEALPDVIAGLRAKGYCFTTVGDLLLKGETVMDHTGRQMPAKQE